MAKIGPKPFGALISDVAGSFLFGLNLKLDNMCRVGSVLPSSTSQNIDAHRYIYVHRCKEMKQFMRSWSMYRHIDTYMCMHI